MCYGCEAKQQPHFVCVKKETVDSECQAAKFNISYDFLLCDTVKVISLSFGEYHRMHHVYSSYIPIHTHTHSSRNYIIEYYAGARTHTHTIAAFSWSDGCLAFTRLEIDEVIYNNACDAATYDGNIDDDTNVCVCVCMENIRICAPDKFGCEKATHTHTVI